MVDKKVKDVVITEEKEQRDLVADINSNVPQLFIESQRNLILNETPRYKIKKRKGKAGLTFDYVDIGYVLEQLNILTGHRWDFDIEWQLGIPEAIELKQFIVRGRLTLKGSNGEVVSKVNYGKSDIAEKTKGGFLDFGNDMKAAVSDCVKKCSSMFGIALDVYSGGVKRRQDSVHPEAVITEEQKIRLEAVAVNAKIGDSGLIKVINEMYDYKHIEDIQRQHFVPIMSKLESMEVETHMNDIPERMQLGFDILNIPKAKRLAVYRSYEKNGTLEELEKKIQDKIKEQKDAKK